MWSARFIKAVQIKKPTENMAGSAICCHFLKLTYYVVDVGSKNSTRLGCKKRTKN